MTYPVVTRSRFQRVIAPARLHPSLTIGSATPVGPAKSALGVLPMSGMVLAGLYAAYAAEFTAQAWPLAVLLALPVAALVFAWMAKPIPKQPIPRRKAKQMIDRRPVLLRPVLVLPPGRPARITGTVPKQQRLLHIRQPNRPAKIIKSRWIMTDRPN